MGPCRATPLSGPAPVAGSCYVAPFVGLHHGRSTMAVRQIHDTTAGSSPSTLARRLPHGEPVHYSLPCQIRHLVVGPSTSRGRTASAARATSRAAWRVLAALCLVVVVARRAASSSAPRRPLTLHWPPTPTS
ncbi:hypothetical protein GUJ93_ZPchr0009g1315 [Zizania palustris]|uniref:Uncharacterized protein n=1 Tax=Zizania palustris TaxID=103762 RepID=A0A8J5R8G9_ZIZPA|nr:hypothetical protein GUJ93_ZPchr0009g1315 [Zizania palustris]